MTRDLITGRLTGGNPQKEDWGPGVRFVMKIALLMLGTAPTQGGQLWVPAVTGWTWG